MYIATTFIDLAKRGEQGLQEAPKKAHGIVTLNYGHNDVSSQLVC